MVDPLIPFDMNEEQRETWRKVFLSNENGFRVLTQLLKDLGFFDAGWTPEAQALRNYSVRILEILGIADPRNAVDLIKNMANTKPFLSDEIGE